ncbi:MAK10-like protein [Tanacetum coccineum]
MGDENPIRTIEDYSKPSHEGYRNTIELPVGNNVVPLRSDTIRLVQNGFSFHGLRFEDPNQHLKDFLKLVDSLDIDRSITTWEDLTTRFLAQFFLPGRTAKLHNDTLMFQQHHGESLSEAWTRFKDLLQKVPHHGIDLWLQVQIFYDHVNPVTRRTIDQSAGGKIRDLNTEESWALLKGLALYDNEIQRLMEAHLAPAQPSQVNKITTSCEIFSGPHDTQYCMEGPEQAFVEYASSRTNEAGEGLVSNFMASQDARLSKFEADFKQQQSEMTDKIDIILKAITDQIAGTLPGDTVKNLKLGTHPVSSINTITIHPKQQSDSHDNTEENKEEERGNPKNHPGSLTPPDPSISFITEKVLKFNSLFESLGLAPPSPNAELVCTKEEDIDVMIIEIIPKDDNSHKEEPKAGVQEVEYFDIFLNRSELAYHKYLMCGPIPSIFLRNPIIIEGCPSNLKIPCNIGHVHVEKAYIDLNSPLIS